MFSARSQSCLNVLPLVLLRVAFTLALALVFTGVVGIHAEAATKLPDLIVSAVSAPSTISSGTTVGISATVKNKGNAATSSAFSVSFYGSTSASSIAGAVLLVVQNIASLPAGTSMVLVASLAVPPSAPSGTYYLVVVADSANVVRESNENNNIGSSGAIVVTNLTPPTISGVNATGITASNATITWTTDKSSTSQADYGTTAAYGSATALNSSLVTSHAVTLSGLTAGKAYHFQVQSKDAAGNTALSTDYTFTTATAGMTYYVAPTGSDTADGSATYPWATIQHAADTVGPGDVVHVAPGNYLQAIISNTSGTATARIQFVSDTKWGAKIISAGAQYTWENHGDYLNIQGFDVTGDGRIGILNWASNVQIIGNHVHDIPATGCPSNGGAGIDHANYSAHDNDTIGNAVHDIGDSTPGCYVVQGIYHSNLRGHIMNNISFRNQGWGIQLYHAPMNVVVSNNLSFANGHGGIVIGAPTGGLYIADGMRVVNNIVVHNGSYGIKEAEQTGSNNQYWNNLVYGNVDDDWYIQGSFAIPPTNIATDPQFVNYQPNGTGNYHLASGSPAIDSGTSVGAPSDDFDGGPRPQGAGWDIGPYEWRP